MSLAQLYLCTERQELMSMAQLYLCTERQELISVALLFLVLRRLKAPMLGSTRIPVQDRFA
jgi:hypothetical protein